MMKLVKQTASLSSSCGPTRTGEDVYDDDDGDDNDDVDDDDDDEDDDDDRNRNVIFEVYIALNLLLTLNRLVGRFKLNLV